MTDETNDLIETIDTGEHRQVEKAIKGQDIKDSRIHESFKLLFGTAKANAILARNNLCAVDPHDWRKIQGFQDDVRRYEEMADWVRAAIYGGEQAFEQLQAMRGESPEEPEE